MGCKAVAVGTFSYAEINTYTVLPVIITIVNIDMIFFFFLVDDPLETTAVHFGGGLWGVIATPLFGNGGFWNNTTAMPVSTCAQTWR